MPMLSVARFWIAGMRGREYRELALSPWRFGRLAPDGWVKIRASLTGKGKNYMAGARARVGQGIRPYCSMMLQVGLRMDGGVHFTGRRKDPSRPECGRRAGRRRRSEDMTMHRFGFALTAAALMAFGVTGCATKNYVRTQTAPLVDHTEQLDRRRRRTTGRFTT